jgi:hypothetical protein
MVKRSPCLVFFLSMLVTIALPGMAAAQDRSYWGVGVSFVPAWTATPRVQAFLIDGDGTLQGSEFSVGMVRGSTRGGDWGVSFVRKPFKEGMTFVESSSDCFTPTQCFGFTQTQVFHDSYVNGFEAHGSFSFVTIKNLVQVGMNVGGGVGRVRGTVEETYEFTSTHPQTGQPLPPERDVTVRPADEVLYKLMPLFKLEAQGAVILTPALKVKVAGGLNLPGTSFRVSAVYLIGAR